MSRRGIFNPGKYSELIHLANSQGLHLPRAVPSQLFHGLGKGNPRGRGNRKQLAGKGHCVNQSSHLSLPETASWREK